VANWHTIPRCSVRLICTTPYSDNVRWIPAIPYYTKMLCQVNTCHRPTKKLRKTGNCHNVPRHCVMWLCATPYRDDLLGGYLSQHTEILYQVDTCKTEPRCSPQQKVMSTGLKKLICRDRVHFIALPRNPRS